MNSQFETSKRLRIANEIGEQLQGIARLVLLGGSMGYGQNYSVTEKSDIDNVIVIDKDKTKTLASKPYFQGEIPKNIISMFENGTINLFWVTKEVEQVEVNSFIYETKSYKDFCGLKGKIVGYISHKPKEIQESYGFDGKLHRLKRNVRPFENGFLYEKPALTDTGKFWGGPPRNNYIIPSHIVYEQNNFYREIEEIVWENVLSQLIREHGENLDLEKFNLLNADFTYQLKREKLKPAVIAFVKEKTQQELSKY